MKHEKSATRSAKPTRRLDVFGQDRPVCILQFGKDEEGRGWNKPRLPEATETLKMEGVRTLLIPNIPVGYENSSLIRHRRHFHPNSKYINDPKLSVRNGEVAGGVIIGNRGDAVGVLSTQPIAVMRFRSGKVVVIPCSENTLLNRQIILGNQNGSRFVSAIHAAMHSVPPWERKGVRVFITFRNRYADRRHYWGDVVYGAYNRAMTEYVVKHFGKDCFANESIDEGLLRLDTLIYHQCAKWGVPSPLIRFDSIDLSEPNLLEGSSGEEVPRSKWCCGLDGLGHLNLAVVLV